MVGVVLGRDMSGKPVLLPEDRRLQGTYVLGKNGTGKSTFLINLIKQDLEAGHGLCVLDPHGDLIVDTLALLPASRVDDVVLLDLQDREYPFAFNLFDCADHTDPMEVAQTAELVTAVFKRVWGDAIGPRSQDVLENTVYALIANPGSTLDDVPRFLTHPATRERMLRKVQNEVVRDYWLHEFNTLRPGQQQQIVAPLLNKIRTFLRHPVLREIVRQASSPDFLDILQKRKIFLVRLNARLEEATSLLGTLITLRLLHAALARAKETDRPSFFLYADEFQRFATPDFGTLLQEARKFGIGSVLAHQLRSQLNEFRELKSGVLGAGTLVCFQLTAEDAREMVRELSPPVYQGALRPFLDEPRPLSFLWDHPEDDPELMAAWKRTIQVWQGMCFDGHGGEARVRQVYGEDPRNNPSFQEFDEWVGHALREPSDTGSGWPFLYLGRLMREQKYPPIPKLPSLTSLPLMHALVRLDRGNGVESVQLSVDHVVTLERRTTVLMRLLLEDDAGVREVSRLLNASRQARGVSPLFLSPLLCRVAQDRAAYLIETGHYEHTERDGRTAGDRLRAAGYDTTKEWGENLAVGHRTPEEVFAGWQASPSHDQGMHAGHHTALGIGHAVSPTGQHAWIMLVGEAAAADGRPTTVSDDLAGMLLVVNLSRRAQRVVPLSPSPLLTRVAQERAELMAATGRFGLDRTVDGTSTFARLLEAGYAPTYWGETIARRMSEAPRVLAAWWADADHHATLHRPRYTAAGLGHGVARDGLHYWLMIFGDLRSTDGDDLVVAERAVAVREASRSAVTRPLATPAKLEPVEEDELIYFDEDPEDDGPPAFYIPAD
jgi:uncharacterized protein YkwD